MKIYYFDIPVTGMATAVIEAENDEEAFKLFKEGNYESDLNEWDFDMPYGYRQWDKADFMDYCFNVEDEE